MCACRICSRTKANMYPTVLIALHHRVPAKQHQVGSYHKTRPPRRRSTQSQSTNAPTLHLLHCQQASLSPHASQCRVSNVDWSTRLGGATLST